MPSRCWASTFTPDRVAICFTRSSQAQWSLQTDQRFVMLPYFLGCPSWNEPAWRGSFYPPDLNMTDSVEHYCRVFNAVEGNTTFYARPDGDKLARWVARMPAHFRFCAKVPRDISHEGDLREQLGSTQAFLDLLAPLGERVTPLWLQLPACLLYTSPSPRD